MITIIGLDPVYSRCDPRKKELYPRPSEPASAFNKSFWCSGGHGIVRHASLSGSSPGAGYVVIWKNQDYASKKGGNGFGVDDPQCLPKSSSASARILGLSLVLVTMTFSPKCSAKKKRKKKKHAG